MTVSADILFFTPITFVVLYLLVNLLVKTPRHVCIVVLGDIGRSPRMQNHATSFAAEGFQVYLVGYRGSKPHENILQNERIHISYVRDTPGIFARVPRILGYFMKVTWQSACLAWTLLLLPKMAAIFIQNPPSIPTMFVSYLVCCVRFCALVIDWHNYGYTILSMALRRGHPLVKFAEWYERKCGRLASHNICVTRAMSEDLESSWNIRASIVYDRPPETFKSVGVDEQHNLFTRLSKDYPVFLASSKDQTCTRFTRKGEDGKTTKLDQRPALLVSSTSWTEDEDFGILLESLEDYDKACSDQHGGLTLPNLVCVITGKGPQKAHYTQKIEERQWSKVQFCLPWLTAEDYPLILGSADLGVCLHKSSSGLDLPMKVVDMFGCGLPVCAANFQCIGELVHHNKNGLIFSDSKELAQQLKQLLGGFPHCKSNLEQYRKNLASFEDVRWHDQWKNLVLPIFHKIGGIGESNLDIPGLFGADGKGDVCDSSGRRREDKKNK